MSNENNIDKLLKESFDNFSPDAPDVWQAVQQGVQAAQASGAVSSGAVVAQGVGLTVKIVAGIAIAAAAVTGYILYNSQPNKEVAKVADPVVNEQIITESEVPVANEQPIKEDVQAPVSPKTNIPAIKQPTSGSTSANQNPQSEKEQNTISPAVSETGSSVAETPNNEPNSTPKETVITEVPKSATKVQTDATVKSDVSKPEAKVSKEKPYNPYAEDGEYYEKPIVPNAFSPNDDGLNDKFKISIENETYYSLKILNEKGEMVFESKNKEQLWDGKHYKTGQPCPKGNYFYVLNYQYKESEKVREVSGLVGLFF